MRLRALLVSVKSVPGRVFMLVLILMLSACSSVSYYSHLVSGQVSLLWNRQAVEDLLSDTKTPESLRERLELSQDIRAFASEVLKLPVGDVYTAYTDLERPYAVWNVYAAPELSLQSHTWCYPILGCLAYRGFYDEGRAQVEANKLEKQGLETRVGGVRAYSTLGVFDDPLLNTFVFTDEAYFIELLIHEISHRKLYIKDDTKFNENFATAVGTLGAELWYRRQGLEERYSMYQKAKNERQILVNFVLRYKDKLDALYQDKRLSDQQKRTRKLEVLAELKRAYQTLKNDNHWDDRYDNWIGKLNNASFSTLSNYQDLVPGFIALFKQSHNWEHFYQQVEALSEKDKLARHAYLKSLEVSMKEE